MIQISRKPTDRVLELGGGSNPVVVPECMGGHDVHLDCRIVQNAQGQQCVDIQWDLNETPLPLGSDEFDSLISVFALEHVSWRRIPDLLKECCRVLKEGAMACFVLPNTEAQLEWIKAHPEGWDGKSPFDSASCVLFGDQDYSDNAHKCYWCPGIVCMMLENAGFISPQTAEYGDRKTDMVVRAWKPKQEQAPAMGEVRLVQGPAVINLPKESAIVTAEELDRVLGESQANAQTIIKGELAAKRYQNARA